VYCGLSSVETCQIPLFHLLGVPLPRGSANYGMKEVAKRGKEVASPVDYCRNWIMNAAYAKPGPLLGASGEHAGSHVRSEQQRTLKLVRVE